MSNPFVRAVKHAAKLRMAIAGPSGSGKTYTGLAVGTALAGEEGKVAVVDTEHGSAEKYSDLFTFDRVNMHGPYHPDKFVEMIHAAEAAGYTVLVIDSLSHAWNGPGGLLEIVDEIGKRKPGANSFAAWKDATPIQNRLVEAIVGADLHIIATMRSKQEYVLDQVEKNGRMISVPRKVGMAPVQRDQMEYEFDVYLDMNVENEAVVSKTRCSVLTGRVLPKPSKELADILAAWLTGAPTQENPLVKEADSLGKTTYGEEWDDKRPQLCHAISRGRVNRSDQLYDTELQKLIDGMKAKGSNGHAPQPAPAQPAPGPAEQEPPFDEPMANYDAQHER